MKTFDAGMITHLQRTDTRMAMCFQGTLTADTIFTFTEHDKNIPVDISDGNGELTYEAATGWGRSAVEGRAKFDIANLNAAGFLD